MFHRWISKPAATDSTPFFALSRRMAASYKAGPLPFVALDEAYVQSVLDTRDLEPDTAVQRCVTTLVRLRTINYHSSTRWGKG